MIDVVSFMELADTLRDSIEKEINEKKLEEINMKLDSLLLISNELILRELRASYKYIEDYIACYKYSSNNSKLEQIENKLLNNTGLNPSLKIGGVNYADISALSYYALAYISTIKKDYYMAQRYIYRMFETKSRLSRNVLCPKVFEKIFKPKCSHCYERYNERIGKLAKGLDYVEQSFRGIAGLGLVIAGVAGGLAFRNPAIGVAAKKSSEELWKNGTSGKEWASLEEIKEDLEISLDYECSSIAGKILKM